MSRFTRADHRFAKFMRVDLGEDAPPPDDDMMSDESADRLIAAMDNGDFDDESGDPTIEDWQEYGDQVEKEATKYHRSWKATERHLAIVGRRNTRLIKILAVSMGCTAVSIFANIMQWIMR